MSRRRIRLNPCDYFFYGQHQLLSRRSPEGNIAYMILDLDGRVEPAILREALARVLARHPSALGRLRISFPAGRPFWKVPARLAERAREMAAIAHHHEDLRSVPDWQERMARLHPAGRPYQWNTRRGPQIRLEQYDLPNGRARIFFRWPHFLMDADGAQWFLSQIGRQRLEDLVSGAHAPAELPGPIVSDERMVDALSGQSLLQRVSLIRRGLSMPQAHRGITMQRLTPATQDAQCDHCVLHRNWDSEKTRQVQDLARMLAPAGPARYARYLAACVLRALDRLFTENGVDTEAYLITMPVRVGMSQHNAALFEKRPVPGNYLVTPVLCGRRDRVADKVALGDDLLEQFQAFLRNEMDMVQWAMMWAASFMHKWSYGLVFKLPLDIAEFASGFSYYGEISQPIRSLCGARVTNLWGGGPTTSPPGLNPVFSKFEDRLNFSLTYDQQLVGDRIAHRYVELIEQEMFDSSAVEETPASAA